MFKKFITFILVFALVLTTSMTAFADSRTENAVPPEYTILDEQVIEDLAVQALDAVLPQVLDDFSVFLKQSHLPASNHYTLFVLVVILVPEDADLRLCNESSSVETGFYYLQTRYYDPEIGRFINADGVSLLEYDPQNLTQYNMFSYCWNSPVNMYDPTGAFPWLIVIGVVALVSIVTDEVTKAGNNSHNKTAQAQLPSGFLTDQSAYDYMRMGFFGADWNGCGWIAAYNAMIMIGRQQQAADVIRYFDKAGKTILFGTFGVAPGAIGGYLMNQGLAGKMNLVPFNMPSNIESVAKKASACILLYAHSGGAHYIAFKWNGKAYDAYNANTGTFSSIDGYLKKYGGTFITIWCVD